MIKIILIITIFITLTMSLNATVQEEVSLSSLIKGNWNSYTVSHNGETYNYKYLRVASNIDYSLVNKPNHLKTGDIFVVFENFIYYLNVLNPEKMKEFIVSGDLFHQIPNDEIIQIFNKKRSNWKITHLIALDKYIFMRGIMNEGDKSRVIDLWVFSHYDGQWKINIVSEDKKRIGWFEDLLYKNKISLE